MGFAVKPALLSKKEMERVHEASLYLLKQKGVIFESEEALALFREHGARVDGKTVFLPEKLVEDSLKSTPSKFRLEAVNAKNSLTIGEGLRIHPCGGEMFVSRGKRIREPSTLQDYEDLQKIYQACGNMDMTGYQPLAPMDVPQRLKGLLCTYVTMVNTDKPWLAPMDFVGREEKREILHLYELVFGEEYVQNHYVTWNVTSPNSPLVYCDIACQGILEFARYNQPVCLVSAPMSGITSPIYLYSTILLQNAETLAGICLAQLARPGLPVLPSASLTYGNMRQVTWECACPDSALMLAGAVQMYKEYYELPARAQTGVTSAKTIDYQAGFETMQSLLLCGLVEVNVTSQSAGSLENLLTTSFEKTVIDDEIISRVRRIIQGIELDEEHLGLEALMETEHGKDFIMHDSTIERLYDGWLPELSDWQAFDSWVCREDREITSRAEKRVQDILDNAKPCLEAGIAKKLKSYIDSIG